MIIEKIKEIFNELGDSSIEFELLQDDNQRMWDFFITKSSVHSVHYSFGNIEYQKEYYSQYSDYTDISICILINNSCVGVWPLALIKKEHKYELVSNGQSIYEPILIDSISKKDRKKINNVCLKSVFSILNKFSIESASLSSFIYQNGVSEWASQLMNATDKINIKQHLFIDLNDTLDVIKGNFRKSYRPLINKGLKKWNIEVVNYSPDIYEEFRLLHINVAGRETRSKSSWHKQLEMLKENNAFLVTLRDDDLNLVGGGFFIHDSHSAYYSVAAYKRELFKEPLGHIVQYKAIEHMISLSIKIYELGVFYSDLDNVADKEKSISLFKSGFSTNKYPRLDFKINNKLYQVKK